MEPEALLALLEESGATVATAESLTGGQLAALLTAVPGASRSYAGGVVAYDTAVKVSLLGVSPGLVDEHGAVSGPCAEAMAEGVRGALGTTYAMATTGVAGPDSQEGKPVGTVYVGVAGPGVVHSVACHFTGGRKGIQEQACRAALSALSGIIAREENPLR